MDFNEIVKNCIAFTEMNFNNANEVILFLSNELKNRNIVKSDFPEAVLKREKKYPTGLYLGEINVAIPHTDSNHVVKSGLAIATLTKPVFFGRMDKPETKIPVHIVFVLAVSDPKEYVKFLSKLTSSFGNGKYMKEMVKAKQPSEIKEIIENIFTNKQEVK